MNLTINGKPFEVTSDPDEPLLWVLRDELGLTGTKFGCGIGICGSCTVHLDGSAARACVTPSRQQRGKRCVPSRGWRRWTPTETSNFTQCKMPL